MHVKLMKSLPSPKSMDAFNQKLMEWSAINLRRFPWRQKHLSNYKYVVSEILLQRTRAETASSFYPVFFSKYPSWRALVAASLSELQNTLRPVGLYKQRSLALSALAKIMLARNGRFPLEREKIDALPGVGQYVANAIELFVHSRPKPLLDVNMARVLERYFGPRKLADIRYDPYLQRLSGSLIARSKEPVTTNWAILDFAAMVCGKKPRCHECVLAKNCNFIKAK